MEDVDGVNCDLMEYKIGIVMVNIKLKVSVT